MDKIDFLLKVQQIADGVDQIEPLLEDLVDAVVENQDCRSQVASRFHDLLIGIDPWSLEIMQYCMYRLRWNDILEFSRELFQNEANVDKKRLYERMAESFQDDWPEREFYRRYE